MMLGSCTLCSLGWAFRDTNVRRNETRQARTANMGKDAEML